MRRSDVSLIMMMLCLIMWNTCTSLIAETIWMVLAMGHLLGFVVNDHRDSEKK